MLTVGETVRAVRSARSWWRTLRLFRGLMGLVVSIVGRQGVRAGLPLACRPWARRLGRYARRGHGGGLCRFPRIDGARRVDRGTTRSSRWPAFGILGER